jgi:hypothetical protein
MSVGTQDFPPQGSFWTVENYLFRNDQQFKQHPLEGLSSAPSSQQIQEFPVPNQYFWRKFIGDPEVSENALISGLENPEKNIYRSRTRK